MIETQALAGCILVMCPFLLVTIVIWVAHATKKEQAEREKEEKYRVWHLRYLARNCPDRYKALIKQKEKQLARLNAIKTDEDFVAYNIAETIYEISELERIEIQEEMEK